MVDEPDLGMTPEDAGAGPRGRPDAPAAVPRKPPDRRRLDDVFGDVLPDPTRDERPELSDQGRDDELLRDVPPHHG